MITRPETTKLGAILSERDVSMQNKAYNTQVDCVAIVGSRDFPDVCAVQQFVRGLAPGSIVVSGGAEGVDRWAEQAAIACGLETRIFQADWKALGRRAGPIRNQKIVAEAHRLVAFWNGCSRGTLNTIRAAREAGLPVVIFDADGKEVPLADALAVAVENGAMAAWNKGRIR